MTAEELAEAWAWCRAEEDQAFEVYFDLHYGKHSDPDSRLKCIMPLQCELFRVLLMPKPRGYRLFPGDLEHVEAWCDRNGDSNPEAAMVLRRVVASIRSKLLN